MPYTPLHVHSDHSSLDGLCEITALVSRAKEMGLSSLAITDHGTMSGAIKFYNECLARGISPIIGVEAYVVRDHAIRSNDNNERCHLTLLAKNSTGYKNLCKLMSIAYVHGFYYKPRIDNMLLQEHGKGIIALSGCFGGKIPQLLMSGDLRGAINLAELYKDIFDEFFIEIQANSNETQYQLNDLLIELSKKTGIPLVATSDAHYLFHEDQFAHEIMLCINTKKKLIDEDRMTLSAWDLHLKTEEEMLAEITVREAVTNTAYIGAKCSVAIDTQIKMPRVEVPEGYLDALSFIRDKCWRKLKEMSLDTSAVYRRRLEHELDVISRLGFSSYFMLVQSITHYARKNNISVGAGRGSAAGALVCYLLEITKLDPIKYGLIFERFLNESRVSLPDIDLDFGEGRDNIFKWLATTYGEQSVAQVGAFGTYGARSAIKDVARVYGINFQDINKFVKQLPCNITVGQLKGLPEYHSDNDIRKCIDAAARFIGHVRNFTTHAAGVVIAPGDITEIAPLRKSKDVVVSQYDKDSIEQIGLVKIDILKVEHLDVVYKTAAEVKEDIDNIPKDDPATINLFRAGNLVGCFQVDGYQMRKLAKELNITSFQDIADLISLWRPATIGSHMIEMYLSNKFRSGDVVCIHPALDSITNSTYGIILYQEQMMAAVRELAGLSLAEADNVRKGMGKKDVESIKKVKDKFIRGCTTNLFYDISEADAENFFRTMVEYAGYCFNLCVAGDTVIRRTSINRHMRANNSVGYSVRQLWGYKNDRRFAYETDHKSLYWRLNRQGHYGFSYSLDFQGGFVKNIIQDIHPNGVAEVVRIVVEGGRSITVTHNHSFPTPNGKRTADDLSVGDSLFVYKHKEPSANRTCAAELAKIISIDDAGMTDVWDVTMAAPYHTFVAGDGIVTCNSHAVSYATIAYQTAYLKAHYPVEYMKNLLTNEMGDKDKTAIYASEARRMSIRVMQPCILESDVEYTSCGGSIRCGLGAIKHLTGGTIERIFEHRRQITDFYDLCMLVLPNKRELASLILSGALDSIAKDMDREIMLGISREVIGFCRRRIKAKAGLTKEMLMEREWEVDSDIVTNLDLRAKEKEITGTTF